MSFLDTTVGFHHLACGSDVEVSVRLVLVPADPNYGADADGRRGMYVPAYYEVEEVGSHCPTCGAPFTAEERATLDARADGAAATETEGYEG